MGCKAPRQRWHSWQPRQRRFCKLQNLKELAEFESHPLHHNRINNLQGFGAPSGQWRAMRDGNAGIHGIPGNVVSVSYRF